MRTDTAPFDNNDVRLALKYALDREALLKTVLRGHGAVGNDHPISPANYYHASELPQRTYDPDKAKFHLKKAGLTSLSVDLSAADAAFAGAVDAAVLYREHAAVAGIEINVVREPNDGYWSNVWMNKPWGMCYWGGRPTEDWMFSTSYAAGASWNDSFWNHERFNKLLLLARAELDETHLRREMYVEMQSHRERRRRRRSPAVQQLRVRDERCDRARGARWQLGPGRRQAHRTLVVRLSVESIRCNRGIPGPAPAGPGLLLRASPRRRVRGITAPPAG